MTRPGATWWPGHTTGAAAPSVAARPLPSDMFWEPRWLPGPAGAVPIIGRSLTLPHAPRLPASAAAAGYTAAAAAAAVYTAAATAAAAVYTAAAAVYTAATAATTAAVYTAAAAATAAATIAAVTAVVAVSSEMSNDQSLLLRLLLHSHCQQYR